jgi:Resolvase, N terminal domain
MRAAVYARMSTDKQSTDSPADQISRCRDFAESRGWDTPDGLVFIDAAVSGATRHNRPGLLAMLDRIAEWDLLLVFDDARLARNTEDAGWVRNQLEEHGRTGFDVSTGLELSNVGSRRRPASRAAHAARGAQAARPRRCRARVPGRRRPRALGDGGARPGATRGRHPWSGAGGSGGGI